MSVKILIEGNFPSIVIVESETDATPYLGHRFNFSEHGKKLSAVMLGTSNAPVTARHSLVKTNFAKSYPVLNETSLAHAAAIADYYLTPLQEVLALMLPPRLARMPQTINEPDKEKIEIRLPVANEAQRRISDEIINANKKIITEHLIWGVTGSGKTRIYEHLINAALNENQQTLILVPEIALSGQIMTTISAHFPDRTVLYHSALSDGERLGNYAAFLSGRAMIAIGTRSAVFLPAKNLGQIIIDEEHDGSFKDMREMRYDARTVARLRQQLPQSDSQLIPKLVLGSATPQLETLSRAKSGQAKLHRLKERATGQSLPHVYVPEYKFQHGIIAPFLQNKMREHLASGNQVLLLMNRRGHSTHVHCSICDSYSECPRCAVTLTYHKDESLRCHQCGYSEAYTSLCPKDGNPRKLSGRGIQRVEEILEAQFPNFQYARLDRDTARRKNATEEILADMRSRQINILIGTQMVAKGFDLEGVTLVGVLAIDQTLNSPDFRAAEQTWQLLAQVIGRSGRHQAGEVVVQTMATDHYAIRAAMLHDDDSFYAEEARFRKLTNYPPFGMLARLILFGKNETELYQIADKIAVEISPTQASDLFTATEENRVTLLGPAFPYLRKAENEYRVHFLLKSDNEAALRTYLTRVKEISERFLRVHAGLRIILDLDPREVA